jgi:hypothetical protein
MSVATDKTVRELVQEFPALPASLRNLGLTTAVAGNVRWRKLATWPTFL